ncbi:MAG TPA: S4 domain-containing protein [Methyloceanibacter sp.]|nr:S4 domain-containing protein [Methyloceanibacter sp.]
MQGQRLDKWLWCARLVRTRAAAQQAIAAGKIRINGARALKASKPVQAGDVVTATLFGGLSVVRVVGMAQRRGSPAAARSLYDDLTPQQASLPEAPLRAGPRPTKRDRRRLDALRGSDG